MITDNQALINRLLNIEAWAEGLREECHKMRKMIEGGVSTPATDHHKIDPKTLSTLLVKRKSRIIRNRPQPKN